MKNVLEASLRLILAGMMITLVLSGCQNKNTKQDNKVTQNLMVETVVDSMYIAIDSISIPFELNAEVDFPIDGPQPLADSVIMFIINELYRMFAWEDDEKNTPFNQVFEWNGDNVVTVFFDKYRSYFEDLGAGAKYLNLKIVAQTETYVTYFGEYTWCGGSCSTEWYFFTFRKRDGHLLQEIVSNDGLKAFLEVYPQYRDALSNILLGRGVDYFGLMNDGFQCNYLVLSDWPDFNPEEGWHKIVIPYSEIKPYLSKEAQELIPND